MSKLQHLSSRVRQALKSLPPISSPSFSAEFDVLDFPSAKVVCIGDGSHGTSEFYSARIEITKRVLTEHGYNVVAIEADWPDASMLNKYIQGKPIPSDAKIFERFPQWMWKNSEMYDFINWLKDYNSNRLEMERVSFFGLDLYSINESIDAVIKYLEGINPKFAEIAKKQYSCLNPWRKDPHRYGLNAYMRGYGSCEEAVVSMLSTLLRERLELYRLDPEGFHRDFFDAENNARLVVDAEAYYRAAYYGRNDSWNLRDTHMCETLLRIMKWKGKETAKAVVWAHNSHIGDARALEEKHEQINIGQLCRERIGIENVRLIGCGTHTGTVAASDEWGYPMMVMEVNPSREDSWERVMHETGNKSFFLDLRAGTMESDLRKELSEERLERFIGVIYKPETERWSHYQSSRLSEQFDAYVWFDFTEAIHPFTQEGGSTAEAETWPFGL